MVYFKKGQLISAMAAMAAFAAVLAGCGGDESSTIGASIPVSGKARTISVYVRRTVVTSGRSDYQCARSRWIQCYRR
jgi:ABC-type uncharacterized transport system auxiliary subunit